MNKHATTDISPKLLTKLDPHSPAIKLTGPKTAAVKAGTIFDGVSFGADTAIIMPDVGLETGCDYGVMCTFDRAPQAVKLLGPVLAHDIYFAGFHFAPGSNAPARVGGDEIPAINPRSLWDLEYRPAADPRGMALCERFGLKFWGDIYLLGVDHHINGTSQFGATIADGDAPPVNPATGKKYRKLDYPTAVAVLAHHGKQPMSSDEFRAFAFGVTEKTSRAGDPRITGLDAARTSQDGAMQATGNLWVWGHDGDPDTPRASIFGGSWWSGEGAGSRFANLGIWPDNSSENIGARGRSDHLQLD